MNTFLPEPVHAADVRNPHYQELKGRVHQELLGRLNLERLTRVKREDAEPEIRSLILGLLDRETQTTPLSLFERDALITDVLHEIFGLGPLEALLKDPTISGILVNRYNQVYIERDGRLEETTLQGERAVARTLAAGNVSSFDTGCIHGVANRGPRGATSVHVYSPPITSMRYYARTPDGTLTAVRREAGEWDAEL